MKHYISAASGVLLVMSTLAACGVTTPMDEEAERDAMIAECQLIEDDMERRDCLERVALGERDVDPAPPIEPVN